MPLFGRRDAGNLSVFARYGKHDPIRLLYCKARKPQAKTLQVIADRLGVRPEEIATY